MVVLGIAISAVAGLVLAGTGWWRLAFRAAAIRPNQMTVEKLDLSDRSLIRYRMLGIPQRCARKSHDLGRSLLKRFAGDAWPVDERFYLGDDVPYRASVTPWVSRWRAYSEHDSAVSSRIQQRALCWAATALIGRATSLWVWESRSAEVFFSYASRDPKRQLALLTGDQDGSGPEEIRELTLSFITESSRVEERLEQELSFRRASSRCVWGIGPEQVKELGGTDRLYEKLSTAFRTVRLYWLPNSVVPWVEPLPGPLKDVAVLAECTDCT